MFLQLKKLPCQQEVQNCMANSMLSAPVLTWEEQEPSYQTLRVPTISNRKSVSHGEHVSRQFRSWHGEFSDAYGLWWASLNAPLTVEIPPQWFCDAFGWQYGFHTHVLIEHVLPTFLLPEVAPGISNASSPYPGLPQPHLTLTNGRTVPATAATHDMLLWSRPRLSVSRVCHVWSFFVSKKRNQRVDRKLPAFCKHNAPHK